VVTFNNVGGVDYLTDLLGVIEVSGKLSPIVLSGADY